MYKPPKGFVTVREAAKIGQVTEITIRNLITSKKLTRYKRAGRTLIDEKELEAYFRVREV
jgi:excisionase family DNA binding protein